jgi:hypothetical protein
MGCNHLTRNDWLLWATRSGALYVRSGSASDSHAVEFTAK